MTRPNWPDDVETVAQRVLDGKATPDDAETLALWALQVAKFIRIPSDKPAPPHHSPRGSSLWSARRHRNALWFYWRGEWREWRAA